ncbi:hypothetical protein P9X10_00880 [Bacillus cereus]|nr:hypothetical protein [Bacillus cereus]
MDKIKELAEKLYDEKLKLENTYKGIRLVGILKGINYWHVEDLGYKIVDINTGEVKDTTLTMEQIEELLEDEFQDHIKDEFYSLDFVKTLIKNGVSLSLEILGYKNFESYLSFMLNENINFHIKEYLLKEDETVVVERMKELQNAIKEFGKQQIKENRYDEISNIITAWGSVSLLYMINLDLKTETEKFGKELILGLVEEKEFEQVV